MNQRPSAQTYKDIFRVFLLFFLFSLPAVAGHGAETRMPQRPAEIRPYADTSPWNRKIDPQPKYEITSDFIVSSFSGVFGCDPDRYTLPVYLATDDTIMVSIMLTGTYSAVSDGGNRLSLQKGGTVSIPLPKGAEPARGSDSQIVVWNPQTGDEWGFWRISKTTTGWRAVNGYHYNTRWSGVPPAGFLSRGAGIPYLAGLIRPWEIKAGVIEHAIALGYNSPNSLFIYPATKSDGDGLEELLPMGTRLQLNPSLTEADFDRFGLDRTGKIIARALQTYGMIVVDGSGHPKIYVEYSGTAGWTDDVLHKNTVKNIPYEEFRVLRFDQGEQEPVPPSLFKSTTF